MDTNDGSDKLTAKDNKKKLEKHGLRRPRKRKRCVKRSGVLILGEAYAEPL